MYSVRYDQMTAIIVVRLENKACAISANQLEQTNPLAFARGPFGRKHVASHGTVRSIASFSLEVNQSSRSSSVSISNTVLLCMILHRNGFTNKHHGSRMREMPAWMGKRCECANHGFFSSQSFLKRRSFLSGSNMGSSRSRAGVRGTFAANVL